MTKINLLNELIVVNKQELSQALALNKEFAITVKGEIKYPPFKRHDIFIYKEKSTSAPKNKQEFLAKGYEFIEKDDTIFIKAANAWQDIINLNIQNCHYNNTSGDAVTEFSDQKIEDMSWMIIDFDVSYPEMLVFLEKNTEITLLCIESKEPYQFSAMGYFDNIEATQKVFYDFCQKVIKEKLANDPDFTFDYLDEDQREAVKYFGVK